MAPQSKNKRRIKKDVRAKIIKDSFFRKKINLGIIIDTDFRVPPLTGVTYRLYYLSRAIQKNNFNVKIFICNRNIISDADLWKNIKKTNLEIHIIPEKYFYNPDWMSDIILKYQIDIIQVEDIQSTIIFSQVALKLKIPLITELHDIEATLKKQFGHGSKNIKISLENIKLACDLSDVLVCMTKFDYLELVNRFGVKKSKVIQLPNPIDRKAFPYVGPDFTSRKVIFIGNMYYPPNRQAVYTIVEKIVKKLGDKSVGFEMAGMAPRALKIKLQNERVKFIGVVNDLTSFLSSATVALCPVTEGSGMKVKILNYCAAGIPVITTNLGRSGYEAIKSLIIEDDIREYPVIIKKLMSNKSKLLSISKQLRKEVIKYYELDYIAKKAAKIYRKILFENQDSSAKNFFVKKNKLKLLWHDEKRISNFSNPYYYIFKNGKLLTKKFFS